MSALLQPPYPALTFFLLTPFELFPLTFTILALTLDLDFTLFLCPPPLFGTGVPSIAFRAFFESAAETALPLSSISEFEQKLLLFL